MVTSFGPIEGDATMRNIGQALGITQNPDVSRKNNSQLDSARKLARANSEPDKLPPPSSRYYKKAWLQVRASNSPAPTVHAARLDRSTMQEVVASITRFLASSAPEVSGTSLGSHRSESPGYRYSLAPESRASIAAALNKRAGKQSYTESDIDSIYLYPQHVAVALKKLTGDFRIISLR